MLVLSRQRDEAIVIGGNIEVIIVDIRGDKVRLGIKAPADVSVNRQEIEVRVLKEMKDRELAYVPPAAPASV